MRSFLCSWLCLVMLAGTSVSQQAASAADPDQASGQAQVAAPAAAAEPNASSSSRQSRASGDPSLAQQEEKSQEQTTGTSNDRLFWALPNFLTVRTNKIPPLTAGQKYKVVARTSFDPVEYPYIAFLAGISQATDSERGYGQGARGYGKRYGAAFADNTIENFMTAAVLPSLLKEDPRFYQLGKGSFAHRTEYAVSRIFVTRTDSGGTRFNFSEIAGSALAAGISNYSYHPREDRTVANAMSVWGTQVGWDTATIVIKEFWPDIRRRLTKKKTKRLETDTARNQLTSRRN